MIKSYLLVFGQVLFAGLILSSGQVISGNITGGIFQSTGLLTGLWSLYIMSYSKLSIFPEPRNKAHLIVGGPYRLIRHPMYLSLLLILVPLVIESFSVLRMTFLILFLAIILLKTYYEEKLLELKFKEEYQAYKQKSKRIIPFIY